MLSHIFPRPDNPDGAPFIRRQATELVRRGVELKVVSPVPWAPPLLAWNKRLRETFLGSRGAPRRWQVDGVEVVAPRYVKLPGPLDFGAFGPLYCLGVRTLVHHLHREWGFDLIHGQMLVPDGFAAAALGRRLGVPSVATERGYISRMVRGRRDQIRALGRAIAGVDQCVFVSQALAELAAPLGTPRRPFRVVYTGCDEDVFAPRDRTAARMRLGLPAAARIIVHIGRHVPAKGVDLLLEAFACLAPSRPDAVLCLVGEGLLDSLLRARIDETRLQERVRMVGFRPHREIPAWLAACDLVVHPSRLGGEGLPNALVEAGAMGRPAVASRTAGIPEVVTDGETGLLVPPGDAGALAGAMSELLDDPGRATAMGGRARDLVLRRFSWRRHGDTMFEIYRSLVGDRAVAV